MANYASNKNIIEKGVTVTGDYPLGLLAPEQSKAFIKMIIDNSNFLGKMSYEVRKATKGTISKLGISKRNLRKKIENTDNITGKEVQPIIGEVAYECVDMTLGAQVSNKWYRENIEGENFEDSFLALIAQQLSADIQDLAINGDTDASSSDEYYDFLSINDGIVKQALNKVPAAQIIDAAAINEGNFTDQYFYELIRKLPRKYFDQSKYKWICSSLTGVDFIEYLRNRQTSAGDAALIGGVSLHPLSIGFEHPTHFPDGLIMLADPANFKSVYTYDIKYKKTEEGKELVAKDDRFYAWFLNNDTIIMEPEAIAIVKNAGQILNPQPIIVQSAKTKPTT